MNVVGSSTKLLFCEGTPHSLDARLLNRILIGKSAALVVPVGGKYGMRAFIDGYLSTSPANQLYFAFRDRDFDAIPAATVSLIALRGAKPIYMTHRSCIESYLLDPGLINAYWSAQCATPKWKHGAPPGIQSILDWIDDAAKRILPYQAARWALASLKPAGRWPELSTTWTSGSGHLPASLGHEECVAHAKALITDFSAESSKVCEANLIQKYDEFVARFESPAFCNQRDYLIWFHGKDLKQSMQNLHPNSISMDHFCAWGVDNVGWTAHADLQELSAKI